MDNIAASSPEMESENNASADAGDLGSRVARSIAERLKRLPTKSTKCCIYKVPEKFRKVNEEAYTPQLVSIGPLHHGSIKLHFMENIKLGYVSSFMNRTKAELLLCATFLQHSEVLVRKCYQETIMLNSDAFVEMILVDAIFILELFMRNFDIELRDIYDDIFNKQWMISGILHDMLLLENQLPFFVLEDLYNYTSCNPSISFVELCYNYFKPLLHGHEEHDEDFIFEMFEVRHMNNVMHLVDFVRAQLEFFQLPEVFTRRAKFKYTRSITELQEAGVLFRAKKSCFPFDITFTKGILEIPRITVQESTETFFRNIIAFEQCHHVSKFTSSYVIFMDILINTPKDVDILVKSGIIDNQLGDSEDVSTLFNNLHKETIGEASDFCYWRMCQFLDVYSRNSWHRWKAKWFRWKVILKREYFSNPWTIISVIYAGVLLILTIMQTTCSFIAL